jgi:hypothetical protein
MDTEGVIYIFKIYAGNVVYGMSERKEEKGR